MSEHVTRYELEQLRDKMTVVTQQTVAASLSAWHDKMEQSVRNVERQVCLLILYAYASDLCISAALYYLFCSSKILLFCFYQIALLRIGMTDPDRSTGILLTQDEVMAALATPLPSELLLKGTVANEVLQMENKLEEKVLSNENLMSVVSTDCVYFLPTNPLSIHIYFQLESRLQLFLKDRVEGTHNNLYKHLHQQLHNLCAEMGIDYPDVVPSGSFDPDATAAYRFDPDAEEASARSRQNYRIRLLEARKCVSLLFHDVHSHPFTLLLYIIFALSCIYFYCLSTGNLMMRSRN
jgi:hypothetical protein